MVKREMQVRVWLSIAYTGNLDIAICFFGQVVNYLQWFVGGPPWTEYGFYHPSRHYVEMPGHQQEQSQGDW